MLLGLALLAHACIGPAAAAPVPKGGPPSPYGTPVPTKSEKVRFESDRDALAATLGENTSIAMAPGGAPRTARVLTGDFVAEVRVACPLPKDVGAGAPSFGGGLVLTDPKDDEFWVSIGTALTQKNVPAGETWARVLECETFYKKPARGKVERDGTRVSFAPGAASATDVEYRITRVGSRVTLEYRMCDRPRDWTYCRHLDAALPATLTLGAYAYNNLGERAVVRFSNLVVFQGK